MWVNANSLFASLSAGVLMSSGNLKSCLCGNCRVRMCCAVGLLLQLHGIQAIHDDNAAASRQE